MEQLKLVVVAPSDGASKLADTAGIQRLATGKKKEMGVSKHVKKRAGNIVVANRERKEPEM